MRHPNRSHVPAGAPGMMSEEDMMSAMNEVSKVPPGKVRRKKPKGGSRAAAALAELRR